MATEQTLTRNTEKYCRLAILTAKGCTEILRALVLHQMKLSTPAGTDWTVDDFLNNVFTQENKLKLSDKQHRILFPPGGGSTDIKQCDISVLAIILLDVCQNVDGHVKMDVRKMKDIRNKVCHSGDAFIEDAEFTVYFDQLKICIKRCLLFLGHDDLNTEMDSLVQNVEHSSISADESIRILKEWFDDDQRIDKQLVRMKKDLQTIKSTTANTDTKVDKVLSTTENTNETVNEVLSKVKEILGRLPDPTPIVIPDTPVELVVKNCNDQQEIRVSEMLVQIMDPELKNDPELKQLLSEIALERITSIAKDAMTQLLSGNREMRDLYQECVIMCIHCPNFESFRDLVYQSVSGHINDIFKPLEKEIRGIDGYEEVSLEAAIPDEAFWTNMDVIVDSIIAAYEYNQNDIETEPIDATMQDTDDPLDVIQNAEIQPPDDTRGGTRIRINIKPRSMDQYAHIVDTCTSDSMKRTLDKLALAVREYYHLNDLSIEAKLAEPKERNTEAELAEHNERNIDAKLTKSNAPTISEDTLTELEHLSMDVELAEPNTPNIEETIAEPKRFSITTKPGEPKSHTSEQESDSDGEGELEATFSSMKQPPLIKQLRGILSEYPDGGQIIKELIQNAEDAGASEMKILYDRRAINHQSKDGKLYNKFFQAPALSVYNNAVFTKRDWEGIQMIYSRVKEEDRMKVGRFGLGFKSVFHITDTPCVVSGEHLLMIDPHQKEQSRVNAKMKLKKLNQYRGMDLSAFEDTLCGTFGLDRDTLRDGKYPGTIFWFPLRQQASDLSSTLYTKEKVESLFEAFKAEASCVLIFLKHLTTISVHERSYGKDITEIQKVELVDNAEQGLNERKCFKEKLLALQNDIPTTPISSCSVLTVEVTDEKEMNLKQVYQWLVVNYFMGSNASPSFMKLIKNDQLGLTPYVGVAAPLGKSSDNFVGHVFCFLPLPKEGSRLTGLPFHINGFFSLSQNRHHLKWATDEQDIEKVDDNTIQWNRKLITECLPLAYERLLQFVIDYSIQKGNSHITVQSVYNAIPNPSMVPDKKWQCLLEHVFSRVQNMPILYRKECLNVQRCEWIPVKRARFATLMNLPGALSHIKPAVIKALFLLGEEYVDVTAETFQKLNETFPITDLTPDILSNLLKRSNVYTSMTNEEKTHLLQYLLSGSNYRNVEGLQLLPLASGAWAKFGRHSDAVYICTEEQMRLLPGLENKLLLPRSKLPTLLLTRLEDMRQTVGFQLRLLDVSTMINLISDVLSLHLGSKYPMCITSGISLTISWVQDVWTYFRTNANISAIAAIPLFPIVKKGTRPVSSDSWELVRLDDLLILKQVEEKHIPDNVCKCLEVFHVKIVPTLPDWTSKMEIKEYIYMPSSSSIMEILSRVASLQNYHSVAQTFNEHASDECRRALLQFIGNCIVSDTNTRQFLKSLKMFEEVKSTMNSRGFVSLYQNNSFVGDKFRIIRYPAQYIDAKPCSAAFLRSLGAKEVQDRELVLTTIQSIVRNQYTEQEKTKFMEYFVKQFNHFESDEKIVEAARSVRFLKTTSGDQMLSEVFNPHDNSLQELFQGEDRFPPKTQISQKHLSVCQTLGLQGHKDITADILLQTAIVLDKWSVSGKQDEQMKKKSFAFMKYIKGHPTILEKYCRNRNLLKTEIRYLRCIRYEPAPSSQFPLPWNSQPYTLCAPADARDVKMHQLVGCTMPLVKSNEELSKTFGWRSMPPINKVLTQLLFVKNNYEVKNKPELLPIIKCIYEHLNKRRSENMSEIASQGLIWVGNGFESPRHTVIHHCDLNLRPYIYNIPKEFSNYENFFQALGCYVDQTVDVLLETLDAIRKWHTTVRQPTEIKRDTMLTFNILEKLVLTPGEIKGKELRTYIPTHTGNSDLVMKAIPECIFDLKRRYYMIEDLEETVYFIHEGMNPDVAEKLGIKSLSAKTLSETEELQFEQWGQDEPLTARIKTLLKEGYKDGLSVPKELIQNADDAGATEIKFLYDERENDDMKEHVFSTDMKECQGPALWVFNNSRFTNADFANITKLNGATKANESHTIGKFGLGFYSVYNLTDVPSFISGNNIVTFDPHRIYLPDNLSGMKIDLLTKQNRCLLRQLKDQFKHFDGIFGCKLPGPDFQEFDGTLFRFPLRTQEQARTSKIKSKPYSRNKMQRLLSMFMNTAGNMLLFTQNMKSVEIYHLQRNAESPADYGLLFKMTREDVNLKKNTGVIKIPNVLREAEQKTAKGIQFREVQEIKISLTLSRQAEELLQEHDIKSTTISSSWLISWATGSKDAWKIAREMRQKGALPLASVGIPVHNYKTFMPVPLSKTGFGFYAESHLYCFLPLPLRTSLSLHINGCFDITSDRRQLLSLTEDDMDSKGAQWNDAMMKDSLVNSFVQLLTVIAQKHMSSSYEYHSLWPVTDESLLKPFRKSFYWHIVNANEKVFQSQNKWVSFHDVIFLDPELRSNEVIGDTAFNTLLHFPARKGKCLVEMPSPIVCNLESSIGSDQIRQNMVCADELVAVFMDNILDSFWETKIDQRDDLILFALSSASSVILEKIKVTPCIPSEPSGNLCRPTELVDPSGSVATMFKNSDGVFPKDNPRFRSADALYRLRTLGMTCTTLTGPQLINRCKSVKTQGEVCCTCAYDRCKHILQYLSSSSAQASLAKDKPMLTAVKEVLLLPVLPRPTSWVFPWKSDTHTSLIAFARKETCALHKDDFGRSIKFALAAQLLRENAKKYVGTVMCILDDSVFSTSTDSYTISSRTKHVFNLLQIRGYYENSIPSDMIIEQISVLSNVFMANRTHCKELKHLLDASFDNLNSRLTKNRDNEENTELKAQITQLSNKPVVLIGEELIVPNVVAYHLDGECAPDLFQLPATEAKLRDSVYDAMGVIDHFHASVIVNVLEKKKLKWHNKPCQEIHQMEHLLINLVHSMENDDVSLQELDRSSIVAPDRDCYLLPAHELVFEDDDSFRTSLKMKHIHDSISLKISKVIGVKMKETKCRENISVGIPFGQKEKLVNRLKNLLHAYPCDGSIMKELLQNADDAKANEIHFIKDYRTSVSQERTLGNKFVELQGPALCVFNDSYFTTEDLEGIQKLGEGSKVNDPTKTGQYGVGFNAVYHLTDAPSFMTKGPNLDNGGTICIFDPLCRYIPDVTEKEPGRRYEVNGLKESFPGVLPGYLENHGYFSSGNGTMFRLPLRGNGSDISSEITSTDKLDGLLSSFTDDMFEALLFARNVKCIRISNVTSGNLVQEYSVSCILTEEVEKRRIQFFDDVNDIVQQNMDNKGANISISPLQVGYDMTIVDSKGRSEKWYVCQRFGFGNNTLCPGAVMDAFIEEQLGLLPIGGVAVPSLDFNEVVRTKKSIPGNLYDAVGYQPSCKAFCFLPLPLQTGFPVHINGHFALDHEARRSLWKGGFRQTWNELIITEVIVPAWIVSLQHMQDALVSINLNNVTGWSTMNILTAIYHSLFPIIDKAKDEVWKTLTKKFYETLTFERIALFPVVTDEPSSARACIFEVSWTPIGWLRYPFDGVFNTLIKYFEHQRDTRFSENLRDKRVHFGKTLKAIGVKLIETPRYIQKTIENCGIQSISTSNPDFIICFLKSFADASIPGYFNLGEIDCSLDQTSVKTMSTLLELTDFIQKADTFLDKADGLPIILTADNILRTYSSENTIFYLKYTDLLPMSRHVLLHEKLLPFYSYFLPNETCYIRKLTVQDFVDQLPNSSDESILSGTGSILWNKDTSNPLSVKWIRELFLFLFEEAQRTSQNTPTTHLHKETFRSFITLLGSWKLLPTKRVGQCFLCPLSNAVHTLLPKCIDDDELQHILEKLMLPQIDESVFQLCANSSDVIRAIQSCVASVDNTHELLMCLAHYRSNIASCELSCVEGRTVLSFFSRRIYTLQKTEDVNVSGMLRSLPLFITQQNTLVHLPNNTNILVLPDGMPSEGIEEWGSSTGVLLLKKIDELENLYKMLSLPVATIEEVYVQWLLPRFQYLPREHWLKHITYLKVTFLQGYQTSSNAREMMTRYLIDIPFVQIGEHWKRVSDLYNADHRVFRCMLSEDNFPPEQFNTYDWRILFSALGLIDKPTDTMVLGYARDIEREGAHSLCETTKEKSNVLVDYFLSIDTWHKQTLVDICAVKFIIPYHVSVDLASIHPQHNEGRNLICFQKSTYERNERLCWTTVHMLSNKVRIPNDNMEASLGVCKTVNVFEVTRHCQNICDKLGNLLDENNVTGSLVQNLMEHIYNFFERNMPIDGDVKRSIAHTPIVFIHTEKQMVKATHVVIELNDEQEVKPYLFKAPKYYGRYHDLFVEFGSESKVSWMHYALVLEQMKAKQQADIFMAEKTWVKVAVDNLFSTLKHSRARQTHEKQISILYLPDRSMMLQISTQLVVTDDPELEKRLSERLCFDYFVGFDQLQISITSAHDAFKLLPSELQPRLISEIVSEEVDLTDLQELSSRKARNIENFIHSDEFKEGILRMILHQLKLDHIDFDEKTYVIPICSNLQSAKVIKVSGLKTVLRYDGNGIDGTERTKHCFVKDGSDVENTCYKLYFQEEGETDSNDINDIVDEEGGLTDLIDHCTMQLLGKQTLRHLPTILKLIGEPDKIKPKLFQLKIGEYTLPKTKSTSMFPPPGTHVEKKFHPFLEQCIAPFRSHEYKYAALEIEDALDVSEEIVDESSDDYDDLPGPVYIYVHILRVIREPPDCPCVQIQYEIEAGRYNPDSSDSDSHVVSITRLYRFVRQRHETSTEVVKYEREPVGSVPFDEVCRDTRKTLIDAWKLSEPDRRRIIRRLLLQWHPDKNPGNEEYCTRVFQYIQEIILRLENGEDVRIDEDVNDGTGRSAPNTSHSRYHDMGCNINRRAKAHSRAYRDNFDEYSHSFRTGRYSHTTEEVPNIGEARRWMRQAKQDYLAAAASMPAMERENGYNWVCYECHQACEKALKAAWFAKNANNFSVRQSHSLTSIAIGLSSELCNQASRIESRIGHHTRMRYPDSVAGLCIPSDVFSRDDAEYVLEITKELLDNAEQRIM